MFTNFNLNKIFEYDGTDVIRMLLVRALLVRLKRTSLSFFACFEQLLTSDFNANELRSTLQALGKVYTLCGSETYVVGKGFLVKIDTDAMENGLDITRCTVHVYAEMPAILNRIVNDVFAIVANANVARVCKTQWYHGSGSYDFNLVYQYMDSHILSEAYPFIPNLESIAREYAQSNESVLILVGEPGTGKSRLIRYLISILAEEMQRQELTVFYTASEAALRSEVMFTQFQRSDAAALILEDADLHLGSRSDGNDVMTRLLAASDSFISSNLEKKIILTTNLASLNNIDDALLRPGRCFGVIETRRFTRVEAQRFFEVAAPDRQIVLENELYTLAELYRLISPHAESVRQLSDSARYKLATKRGIGFAAV